MIAIRKEIVYMRTIKIGSMLLVVMISLIGCGGSEKSKSPKISEYTTTHDGSLILNGDIRDLKAKNISFNIDGSDNGRYVELSNGWLTLMSAGGAEKRASGVMSIYTTSDSTCIGFKQEETKSVLLNITPAQAHYLCKAEKGVTMKRSAGFGNDEDKKLVSGQLYYEIAYSSYDRYIEFITQRQ
jgi:hypothetical protein